MALGRHRMVFQSHEASSRPLHCQAHCHHTCIGGFARAHVCHDESKKKGKQTTPTRQKKARAPVALRIACWGFVSGFLSPASSSRKKKEARSECGRDSWSQKKNEMRSEDQGMKSRASRCAHKGKRSWFVVVASRTNSSLSTAPVTLHHSLHGCAERGGVGCEGGRGGRTLTVVPVGGTAAREGRHPLGASRRVASES